MSNFENSYTADELAGILERFGDCARVTVNGECDCMIAIINSGGEIHIDIRNMEGEQ